jgi:hypothetical protein
VNPAAPRDAEIDEAELLSALRAGRVIDGGAINGGEAGALPRRQRPAT